MSRSWIRVTVLTVLATTSGAARAQEQTSPPAARPTAPAVPAPGAVPHSAAATAIAEAAKANKYVFLFFYRTEDEPTLTAREAFDAAMEKLSDRATSVAVSVTDPQEQVLVRKHGLNRAPMPLVLAMAPNGAVTRALPGPLSEAQLETAFVSPGMQKCLRTLQDRKMAFVCVQNGTTQHNTEAMRGVREFAGDVQYATTTEVIAVDPADAAEESFLRQLKVDPKTDEAVTVLLAPPGRVIGTYRGEVNKDVLVAAVKTAAAGCSPASGCCPAPKKP